MEKIIYIFLIHCLLGGTTDLVDKVVPRSKGKIPLVVFLMIVEILSYIVIIIT